ncbi:MAG TPA: DedA family protein [Acidimicrobiales bacterium]|nr:DedA family protein [Acidimicrobiales bacterium]
MLAVTIDHLLQTYGYLAVFLAVAAESFGVPLPGETILIAAALYAGHSHRLDIVWVVVVASAAAIIGDNIGYLVGRVGGYRLLRRYGRYVRMDEAKIKVGRYLFHRHGGKVVLFGRFVSVLRTYAAFLAGTNKMYWRRFLVFNAVGGILWATLFGVGAYVLGDAIHRVGTIVTYVGIALASLAVVAGIILFRRRMGTLELRAEQAFPGPLETAPTGDHEERATPSGD